MAGASVIVRAVAASLPSLTRNCHLTPRRAAWLLLRRPDDLQPKDQLIISLLSQQNPRLALSIQLALDFTNLVRQRLSDQFDSWLLQALDSQIPPLQRFALSLRSDYDAVKAGVSLPTSNGQVEGQINRLKTLKRQMYGRAGTDLLAKRFLLAD
jgi:transposase